MLLVCCIDMSDSACEELERFARAHDRSSMVRGPNMHGAVPVGTTVYEVPAAEGGGIPCCIPRGRAVLSALLFFGAGRMELFHEDAGVLPSRW